jgi:hypothetical protein
VTLGTNSKWYSHRQKSWPLPMEKSKIDLSLQRKKLAVICLFQINNSHCALSNTENRTGRLQHPKNGTVPNPATSILAQSKVLAPLLQSQTGPSKKSEKIHASYLWAPSNNAKESSPPSLLPTEIWTPIL